MMNMYRLPQFPPRMGLPAGDVMRPAPGNSPPPLHSLALVKCLGLPTTELAVLPPSKSKQVQAVKQAPGRYILVEESRSSKRFCDYDENARGRSGYALSIREFNGFLLGFKDDNIITVTHGDDMRAWTIQRNVSHDWNFTVNRGLLQDGWIDIHKSIFKALIGKDGSINTEFFVTQQNQNPDEFKVQIKITFEEDKMDVNVTGENEHFVGNFIGKFVKL